MAPCLTSLSELVSTHHVAEVEDTVVKKLNQLEVREEDFSALMQHACGEATPRQKLLRRNLARFLGKHCPSSYQVFKGIILSSIKRTLLISILLPSLARSWMQNLF